MPRILLVAVIACAAFAGLVWMLAERLIFLPPRQRYERTAEIVLVPRAKGGAVAAVHLPDPAARLAVRSSSSSCGPPAPPESTPWRWRCGWSTT